MVQKYAKKHNTHFLSQPKPIFYLNQNLFFSQGKLFLSQAKRKKRKKGYWCAATVRG